MAVLGAAAVAAAAGIAKALIPTNTTSTTSGSGNSSSSSSQHTEVDSAVVADTNTNTTVNSFLQSISQASADPDVIANLKSLASQAMSNANDPTKTQGLISGILQNAGDAMTSIFGAQKTAGGYAGGTAQVLANDTNARATADAASAVLGYKTNEQTLASDALGKLLTATAVNTTTQTGQTTTNTDTTTNEETKAITDSSQNSASATASTSSSSGTSSASIVCTWMLHHGLLERKDYLTSMRKFQSSYKYGVLGYLWVAKYLVAELDRTPESFASRAILWVFRNRTNWVCGRRAPMGALCLALVFLSTVLPGTCYLLRDFFSDEELNQWQ